ncbi:hypothetical protein ACFL6U_20130 [Planctomycetota bacterium]
MNHVKQLRAVIPLGLIVGGVFLLIYGLLFHATVISSADESTEGTSPKRETTLIREVAIGGLERDASGQLKKTYEGPAPKACPT